MKIQKYRFFDHYIELRSDHAETLTLMEAMFRRFALTEQDKKGDKLRYDVLTQIGGKSGIHTHDFCHIVDNTSLLPALAHGIILRHFLAHIRSHLLFHAAALSHGKKGVIIAADSGCGKTTLALALVRKGFKLLSDETAALNLSTGTLTPYPRCLWIRAGTRRVFQDFAWDFPTHDIAIKTQERTAIHLSSTLMGNTCQPFCLFMIQRPKQADERLCNITLESLPQNLSKQLQQIWITPPTQYGFPTFKIKEADLNILYNACDAQGILVLDVNETAVDPTYYKQTPQITAMSKLTAAISLLRYFLGGAQSVLVQENEQGNAVGLIQPLVKMLKQVNCYQLTPGRLDHTVEMINDLCQS